MKKSCNTCGKVMETIYPNKKFCSKVCRYEDELKRLRKKQVKKECEQCGEEFSTSFSKQRFCGRECGYQGYKQDLRNSLDRTCKRCGKSIEAPQEGERASKYCSEYCLTGKDGLFRVYILPAENYAGMSYKIFDRLATHRKNGKDTEGYEVVGVYDCPIKAHLHETQLHLDGYDGFYVEQSHFK